MPEERHVDVQFASHAGVDAAGGVRENLYAEPVPAPLESLDLEDLGLEIKVTPPMVKGLLEERVASLTQVVRTVETVGNDLAAFRPRVPEVLPPALTGRFVNPDGSPAGQVRIRALAPTSVVTTKDGKFRNELPWPNPETISDTRGAFKLRLPPQLLPDDGLRLVLQGGNRLVEYGLRRIDLVAGSGELGLLPLDELLTPLPRSIISQLGDLAIPLSEDDLLDHPQQFASPTPTITLGQADCAMDFRSNAGVIDKFRFSMLVRLIAPELSGRRLANRVKGDRGVYTLSTSTGGLDKYIPADQLVQAMGELGSWEIVGRVPVEAPIDVDTFLNRVARNPKAVPKAATLGIGYVLKMRQVWIPAGLSIGDLVYSLPLAPGEQQRIAVYDERETLSVREQESLTADEFQRYNENADSSTNAVFNSAFNESAAGGSDMRTHAESRAIGFGAGVGGFFNGIIAGLGVAGGYADSTTTGSTSSWQNVSSDYVSNAAQDFHSALARSAHARRSANRTSVRLATASERREVVRKVITNHNHNHSLTMQYWGVLRHFNVTSEVDDAQLVCFVPFEVIQFLPAGMPRALPSGSYPRDILLVRYGALLRYHDVLRSRLWRRPEYAHALRLLKSFAGNPTMVVQSSSGSAQDVVEVEIKGSFLPFEDVYVSAVSTSGARVGPVRMTGSSASVPAGLTSRAALLENLRTRRANTTTVETRTATLALPDHIARSNLARFEFSRGFRTFSYSLSLPTGLDFTELLNYLRNVQSLNVTMGADELERELSGPLVFDPIARISPSTDLIEAYNSPGGAEVMPALLPVAAKRLPPELAFADLLRIEALLQHVVENTVEYSKAVWQSLTPEERAILLERFTIGVPTGGLPDAADEVPLLNCVANQVLGYFGNAAVMPFFIPPQLAEKVGFTSRDIQESLLRFHRQAFHPAQSAITLPARGVLGEAVLGHCESSEKIDLTRFWNWQDSPPDEATDPATLAALLAGSNSLVGAAGAQAPGVLTPGSPSMVNINQGPTALTPAELASALIQSRPESRLPQDLTGITQLGAQMGVQTETTAASLDKVVSEASGLAKEALKQLPEVIKARSGADEAEQGKAEEPKTEGTDAEDSTGGDTGGGGTGADDTPIDGGAAPDLSDD